jgi:Ca2+-binding EF-hand superfamily protein
MGNQHVKLIKSIEKELEEKNGAYSQNERAAWKRLFKKYDKDKTGYLFDESLEAFLSDVFKTWTDRASDDDLPKLVVDFKKLLDKNQDGRVSLQEFIDGMHEVYYKFHVEKKDFETIQKEANEMLEERRIAILNFDNRVRKVLVPLVEGLLKRSKWTGSLDVGGQKNTFYQITITDVQDDCRTITGYEIVADKKTNIAGTLDFDRVKVVISFRVTADNSSTLTKGTLDLASATHRFVGSKVQVKEGRRVRREGEKVIPEGNDTPDRAFFANHLTDQETVQEESKREFSIDFLLKETD